MHPEKNTGRFGVSTNQTIKRNDYIRIQERAIGHYQIAGEQAAFSLSRHKAWEMLKDAEPIQEPQVLVDNSNQENRHNKKKQFQQHLNKSKHEHRVQQKESTKLKRNIEKTKQTSIPTETEEPKIVKQFIGSRNYGRGNSIPENGVYISEVMSRAQIYKSMQLGEGNNCYVRTSRTSRKQKKEEFEKSIFL